MSVFITWDGKLAKIENYQTTAKVCVKIVILWMRCGWYYVRRHIDIRYCTQLKQSLCEVSRAGDMSQKWPRKWKWSCSWKNSSALSHEVIWCNDIPVSCAWLFVPAVYSDEEYNYINNWAISKCDENKKVAERHSRACHCCFYDILTSHVILC